jgi:putative CocE/NonD family hydrolase
MNADDPHENSVSRRDFTTTVLGVAALFVLPRQRRSRLAEPAPDYVLQRDVMVAMRDGVHLATDIYLPVSEPGRSARYPVILERTPYDKTAPSRSERTPSNETPLSRAEVAAFFTRRGYAFVYQDCRGRYKSEGEFVKYLSDGNDGYDCCAWITKQPWCNGKIGTMGLSYAAHTQGALGSAGAPGVAAMFLDSGGFSNAYQGGIRQGGAFELKQATWAYSNALESPEIQRDPAKLAALKAVDIRDWFKRMPWRRGNSPVTLAPEYENYLFEQWEHGEFDAYWKQLGIYAEGFYDQFVDAPMVHMSSWFDVYPRTATDNFVGLSKRKRGPVRLIMGPWTHGDRQLTYVGDVDFGPNATVDGNLAKDFLTLRVRWFDRWLKGERNGVDAEPRVRLFIMGGGTGRKNSAGRLDHGGRWRTEPDWPIPDTRWTRYYLGGDGSLGPAKPTVDDASREYRFDPAHPVPSIGGTITSGRPVMVGGAFDQREGPRFFGSTEPYRALADRPDVLVFQTPVLTEDVEVTGPIEATLWISSDCPDTDFTIKLIDVYPPNADYPDGFAMNLTDGILRVRYRDSWEHPALMTPGNIYQIKVSAFPTSNLFVRGHRIRLDVSSSNFPHFDVNSNTGEPEARATSSRVATNRVYLDATRPSHVVLPVIPSRAPKARSPVIPSAAPKARSPVIPSAAPKARSRGISKLPD